MPAKARITVLRVLVFMAAAAAAIAIAALAAVASAPDLASLVFGQPDFYTNTLNQVTAAAMAAPRAVAIDTSVSPNHVWVADTGNNRVLGWNDASTYANGAAADIVIGQPNMISSTPNQDGAPSASTLWAPAGVGVDGAGNLYVADSGNNRVLVFSAPLSGFSSGPVAGGPAAAVFGQGGNFATNTGCASGQVGSGSLCDPSGVAIDAAGNVFIADAGDNRVTVYYAPFSGEGKNITQPASTAANLIVGQTDATGSQCVQGSNATDATLCLAPIAGSPSGAGVTVDNLGNLFVADAGNNRALEYTGPYGVKGKNSTTANLVFTGAGVNEPQGIAIDSAGNLYVGWSVGNEITVYEGAVSLRNTSVNITIGPGTSGPNAASLSNPGGLGIDEFGDLYAADTGDNRVLEYNESNPPTNAVANRVLGQSDFADAGINSIGAGGLDEPRGVAASISGAQTAVYLADTANNRVLGWVSPSTPAAGPADIVIGQTDFVSSAVNAGGAESASTLDSPEGLATDSSGNLFVADTNNNRVLEFSNPAAACSSYPCANPAPAALVFGTCGDFTTNGCAPNTISASTLLAPSAVTFDPAGDLFIADSGDNRVLEFAPSFGAQPQAIRVFGQSGNFTNQQCDAGGISATSLCEPEGVAADSAGNLFVADTGNNRTLEFIAPFSSAPQAGVVFGQAGSFSSGTANPGGASASTMYAPSSVVVDPAGDLFVADSSNNRVLEFKRPYGGAPAASIVFGQPSFSAKDPNDGVASGDVNGLGPDSLFLPAAVAVDLAGNLYAADTSNNRVLMYLDPAPSPTLTASATPSATPSATSTATESSTPTATATATPTPTPAATPTATPTPVAEKLAIVPGRLNFGKVKLGATRTRIVKIVNRKHKNALAVIIGGPATLAAPFRIVNQCLGTLAPGVRCEIIVTFTPTAPGRIESALQVEDNAIGGSRSIELIGVGK